jgi:hypothetical protein
MLDRAIEHGIDSVPDAPVSMRQLFEEFERPPEWLDPALAAKGAALFRRFGPSVFSFAGVETLLGYEESSIVKPLAFTGAYAGDTALNRFMETARVVLSLDPCRACRSCPIGQPTYRDRHIELIHTYPLAEINDAVADVTDGRTVTAVLTHDTGHRSGQRRHRRPDPMQRRDGLDTSPPEQITPDHCATPAQPQTLSGGHSVPMALTRRARRSRLQAPQT